MDVRIGLQVPGRRDSKLVETTEASMPRGSAPYGNPGDAPGASREPVRVHHAWRTAAGSEGSEEPHEEGRTPGECDGSAQRSCRPPARRLAPRATRGAF